MKHRTRYALAAIFATVASGPATACGEAVNPGGERAMAVALAQTAGRVDDPSLDTPGTPYDTAEPHRLKAAVTVTLTEGGRTRRLTLRRTVDRGLEGRFRVTERRSMTDDGASTQPADEGRDAVFDGARFATRRAWGPWIQRETLHRDHHRWLAQSYDAAPALFAAFGAYLVETPDPTSTEMLAGLPVVWSAVGLNAQVAPAPLSRLELTALRDHVERWPAWLAATHRPTRVTGAVAREGDDGAVVAGKLEVAGEALVEGTAASFVFAIDLTIQPLPKRASFEIPDDAEPARRDRFWRDVRDVLGDDLLPRWSDR